MNNTPAMIKELVQEALADLIAIRRHLHAHPELSFQEKNTAAYLSEQLTKWGIDHRTRVAGYGITGVLKGKNPETKRIALRADMDALPISEKNRVPYHSLNKGVMHACGHDLHMTCLLGALKILKQLSGQWEGSVQFIFQPAEEKLPGGALAMIKAGVLENPKPEVIIAQHVYPELKSGKVGFKSGKYMASGDEINLIIKGRGGHAAIPSQFDNTVLAAAETIVKLEKEINRQSTPQAPTILSFGKVVANGAHNVIPSEVQVHGTFRTFDEKWRKEMHQRIKSVTKTLAAKHGCNGLAIIDEGYPFVMNDEKVTQQLKQAAVAFLGSENVVDLDIRMTVEDFGYYSQLLPACFYRLGVANREKNLTSNLHTDTFDVDEESIAVGTGLMVWNALSLLIKKKSNSHDYKVRS